MRSHTSSRRFLFGVAAGAALLMGVPATAQAADPPFVGWSALLPPGADAYQPTSGDQCVAGRPGCVENTIRKMSRRLKPLAASCDHNAVFELAYLRTTETYRKVAAQPGFFADARFVNHEDAVFANYYYTAYDSWAAGKRQNVPQAWRIALDAAAAHAVSGSGDLMLGMNAHVNADLPFVLAAIGLVAPDGSSRKPDHDKVNVFLNQVVQPLIDEEAARFDPAMDDAKGPYGLSYTALMQVLIGWRETAWRNAERLVNAPDAAAREQVARGIQDYAAATARSLVPEFAYAPPVTDSTARDQFCAAHHG